MQHQLATGQTLAERYVVGERLGAGGGGEVWAAHDTRLGRLVAVKVVPEGDGAARLQREARAAAGVNHPNVVQVYDAGAVDGLSYLVMEHVEGVDLGTLLHGAGALGPELASLVGQDLARGLARVHAAGLVHRDVKPGNVLITPEGRAKLADLGIARRTTGELTRRLTSTGTIVGTVDYLAPEQLDDVEAGPTADVYAVGLVVHACCTGAPPFGEGTIAERTARRLARGPASLDEVPEPLAHAVARATRRAPDERPADGHALAHLLDHAVPLEVDGLRARLGRLASVARRAALETTDEDATGALPGDLAAGAPSGGEATTVLDLSDEAEDVHGPGSLGRRLLGPAVVALVALAAAVTASVNGGGGDAVEGGDAGDRPPAVVVEEGVLVPVAVVDHDPFGDDGEENPSLVGLVVDGDTGTRWESVRYNTRAFGGLKDGLGLLLDLGGTRAIGEVELVLDGAGHDITVSVHEQQPTGDPTGEADTLVGAVTEATGTVTVSDTARTGRWVAVWVTRLGTLDGEARVGVAEVVVRGE